MKILLALLLFAFFAVPGLAQEKSYEIGRPSELRGKTKINVYAGVDYKNRERIEKQIKKDLKNVEILETDAGAEIVLLFVEAADEVTQNTVIAQKLGNIVTVTAPTTTRARGAGQVFLPPASANAKPRLLIESARVTRSPARAFAKEFIREYKRANAPQTEK